MSRVVNLFDVCRDNWVCKLNTNKNCFVFPVPATRRSHVIKVCGAWISCSKLLLFPEEINWNHTKWEMSWWRGSCWRRGCLKHKLFFRERSWQEFVYSRFRLEWRLEALSTVEFEIASSAFHAHNEKLSPNWSHKVVFFIDNSHHYVENSRSQPTGAA